MGHTEKLGQPDISSAWVIITGARIKAVGSKPSWESKDAGFSKINLSGLVENKGRLLSGEAQGPAPPTADRVCFP